MVIKSATMKKPTKRSQAKVAWSEELAQALIRSGGMGIYIIQEGRFVYSSPLFQDAVGYTGEELLSVHPLSLVHPEDKEVVRKKAIENLKSQQSPLPYEYRFVKKNGDIGWVLEMVASIKYGGKRSTVGSFIDITERKQEEERYWTILDSIEDAYFEVDIAGNYTFFNDSLCRILGYSREELMGMSYRVWIPEKEVETVYRAFNKVYRTGKPNEGFSHKLVRKNGSDGFCEISISPRRNYAGKIIGFRGVTRDITKRKRAEEELKLRAQLLNSATDSIFVHDFEGNFIYVNETACKIHGYSRQEFSKMKLEQVVAPARVSQLASDFQDILEKGQAIFESAHRRKDGSIIPVEVHGRTIESGGRKLLLTVIRDITQRKQAEAERDALLKDLKKLNRKLEQSNKELQDFVYVASHDLREPLRKITSFGTLLHDSLEGKLDEDQQENFEFMIDGAERMQTMVDDLLTYSRVATRAKSSETVDLNEVVENLKKLELAIRLDEMKGTIHIPQTLLPVRGDPSQIYQLFQNLIGNGLKFCREGIPPRITIRTHQIDDNMVRVEIEDNGIGVDEEYHEQIFTMFKRLHSRTHYEGSGIGLAVCKKIVNRYGGDIGVDSTPGEGSTFWFTLPRGSYSGDN